MDKNILIIDDFESARFITEFTLKNAGYSVVMAKSGEEALQILETSPVGLIITDYNMPQMNGLEFIRRVKNHPKLCNTPIIVLSTENNEVKKLEVTKLGILMWIKKPFKMDEFLKIISKVIDN